MRMLRNALPLAALGLLIVPASAALAQIRPSVTNVTLKAQPEEVVFDNAYVNEKSTTEVKLTNTGDKEVEIVSAKGSCGCTTTGVRKSKLAPGETTSMSVSFKGSRAQAGKEVSKQVTVITKTGDVEGRMIIPVRAHLTAPVMIEPSYVKLTGIERGESVTRDIICHATDGHPFRIVDVKIAGNGVSVTPTTTDEDLQHTLKLTVSAEKDPERMSGAAKLTIQTTHPKDTDIIIPISWTIDQYVDVRPLRMYLGSMKVGEPMTQKITITPRKREKLDELTFSIDGSPVQLKAEAIPDEPNSWNLTFTADESLSGQVVRGNLILDTHVEPEGKIKVPMNGRVLPVNKPMKQSASKK